MACVGVTKVCAVVVAWDGMVGRTPGIMPSHAVQASVMLGVGVVVGMLAKRSVVSASGGGPKTLAVIVGRMRENSCVSEEAGPGPMSSPIVAFGIVRDGK